MVKSLRKFGGAIMLYLVIFFGIVAICSRVNNMNQESEVGVDSTLAINYNCKKYLSVH